MKQVLHVAPAGQCDGLGQPVRLERDAPALYALCITDAVEADDLSWLTYTASGGGLLILTESVGLRGEVFLQLEDGRSEGLRDLNIFGFRAGIAAFVF